MNNLAEEFKREYELYLQEEEENEYKDFFVNLQEAQKEAEKGLDLIEKYFAAIPKENGSINEAYITLKEEENIKIKDLIVKLGQITSGDEEIRYSPAPRFEIVKTIGEMKFPQNIVFFIKQLLSWIRNVVLYFFKRFTNFFKKMIGRDVKPLDKDILSLKNLSQKIEKAKLLNFSFNAAAAPKTQVVRAYNIKAEDIKDFDKTVNKLFESTILKENEKRSIVVSIDLSNDLEAIQALLQHFFDLFDNAYGSNSEFLFGIDDMVLFLDTFEKAFKNIGKIQSYEFDGITAEIEMIDSTRVKDNLIRTNLNVTQLKEAYMSISNKLEDVARIVANKQLIGATNMGASYKFYSASTYEFMLSILRTMAPRLKDAKDLEKKMKNMQEKYLKVTEKFEKLARNLGYASYGNVTYTSIIQRKVSNLLLSAKYMTQTVTLRLSTLALYIKLLSDINETIINLNAINMSSKDIARGVSNKELRWFQRMIKEK